MRLVATLRSSLSGDFLAITLHIEKPQNNQRDNKNGMENDVNLKSQ